MMSYAGIDLPIVTPSLAAWVERTIPAGDLFEFDTNLSLDKMGCLPVPQSLSLPQVHIGRLTWPTGVSQWATFYTVLTGEQLKALRLALIPTPGSTLGGYPEAPLVIDDGKTTLTVQMTLLPPRPLSGYSTSLVEYAGDGTNSYGDLFQDDEEHGELNDLYLVTLVDARYFWWFRQLATDLPTSEWNVLVEALLEALGFTINPSDAEWADLNSGYPAPGTRWQNIKLLPLPLLIDAAASSTGRRAIRKMDTGAVAFQRWDQARTQAQALYAKQYTGADQLEEYDLTTIDFARVAGGSFPAEELRRTVPASVHVTTADDFSDSEIVTLASLSLGQYKSITGRANEQVVIKLSNGDTLTVAIAERAATDWYGWQLANHDITLAGVAAWDACAWQEGVFWDHGAGKIVTRVYRPPFPLGAARGTCGGGGGGGEAAPGSFTAQLTAKKYTTDEYIAYSWIEVTDSDSTPITWSEATPKRSGSPQCSPAYHEGNIDLPVLPPPSPQHQSPQTFDGDDASPGDVSWTTPDNAGASDDAYATATITSSQTTRRLKLTGFCYGLSENATITNVEVRVEAKADASGVPDLEVALIVGGIVGGTSKHTGVDLPTVDTVRSYSHTPADWGAGSLDAEDVNAADFGVSLRYDNTSAGDRTVSIDHVEIRISFTPDGFYGPEPGIVRLRKGEGDYYLIDQLPWEDIFRRTGGSDSDGDIAYHRYYDQNTNTWVDGKEVRIITVS